MTDIHCHILPGIDDGAKDLQASVQLLQKQKQDGVNNIVFTSHFNFERTTVEQYVQNRQQAFQTLQHAPEQLLCGFNFKLGAEVFFSPGLTQIDAVPLCIQDTAYMLIEFPTTHRPHFIRETFRHLNDMGIIPVIAHVERYPYVMHDPTLLYDWVAAGAYAQINAGALLKNDKATKQILQFIKWNLVHVIGTDCHSILKRPPKLKEAAAFVAQKLGEETASQLCRNGDELFADVEPDADMPHRPKKILGMWM